MAPVDLKHERAVPSVVNRLRQLPNMAPGIPVTNVSLQGETMSLRQCTHTGKHATEIAPQLSIGAEHTTGLGQTQVTLTEKKQEAVYWSGNIAICVTEWYWISKWQRKT